MHPVRTAPLLALVLSACSDPRTPPPRADEAPPVSTTTADTGTGAPPPASTAAAAADDGQPIAALARWPGPPSAEEQEALLDGTLVAAQGCLWVVPAAGERYAVVWPAHVELDAAAAPARVTDRRSGASARLGGPVRLGGGELPGARTPALKAALPRGCDGKLWLASGIVAHGD
jgi:hypothetical protein